MKPVFAQSIPLGGVLVDGICADVFGKSLVERRVKVSNVWDLGILLPTGPNDFERTEIVPAIKPMHQWF